MKPDKSYLSLHKGSDGVIKLLFVLFVAQVILLSLCRITIPVPVGLAQNLLEDHQKKGISFDFEQIMFSFPNKIAVRKFVIRKNGRETAVANHLEIQYPLLKLVLGQGGYLHGLKTKSLSLHSMGEAKSSLRVDDLDLHRKQNGEYILNASIQSDHSSLKMKGALDFDYLKSLFKPLPQRRLASI